MDTDTKKQCESQSDQPDQPRHQIKLNLTRYNPELPILPSTQNHPAKSKLLFHELTIANLEDKVASLTAHKASCEKFLADAAVLYENVYDELLTSHETLAERTADLNVERTYNQRHVETIARLLREAQAGKREIEVMRSQIEMHARHCRFLGEEKRGDGGGDSGRNEGNDGRVSSKSQPCPSLDSPEASAMEVDSGVASDILPMGSNADGVIHKTNRDTHQWSPGGLNGQTPSTSTHASTAPNPSLPRPVPTAASPPPQAARPAATAIPLASAAAAAAAALPPPTTTTSATEAQSIIHELYTFDTYTNSFHLRMSTLTTPSKLSDLLFIDKARKDALLNFHHARRNPNTSTNPRPNPNPNPTPSTTSTLNSKTLSFTHNDVQSTTELQPSQHQHQHQFPSAPPTDEIQWIQLQDVVFGDDAFRTMDSWNQLATWLQCVRHGLSASTSPSASATPSPSAGDDSGGMTTATTATARGIKRRVRSLWVSVGVDRDVMIDAATRLVGVGAYDPEPGSGPESWSGSGSFDQGI